MKSKDSTYALFAVGCENCNTPTDLIGLYDDPEYVDAFKSKLDIIKKRKDIKQDFTVYRVDKMNVSNSRYLSLVSELEIPERQS